MKSFLLATIIALNSLLLRAEDIPVFFENVTNFWLTETRCVVHPSDNPRLVFFTNVTNLWWQGHKSNVLAIAEQRLSCNSNDIAGLILKMECDFEFLNLDSISNSIQRVIDCGKTITTSNYASKYPAFKFSLDYTLHLFTINELYANLEVDRAKALLPEKHMSFEDDLLAVCLDGLVTNYPALPPPNGGTAH